MVSHFLHDWLLNFFEISWLIGLCREFEGGAVTARLYLSALPDGPRHLDLFEGTDSLEVLRLLLNYVISAVVEENTRIA